MTDTSANAFKNTVYEHCHDNLSEHLFKHLCRATGIQRSPHTAACQALGFEEVFVKVFVKCVLVVNNVHGPTVAPRNDSPKGSQK